jgi:hypothetical protein
MTAEMRKTLARLPYPEKLRRIAELIDFSRHFKAVKSPKPAHTSFSRTPFPLPCRFN